MKLPQQLVTCSIFAFPLAQNGRLWAFQVQNAVKSGTRSETDSSVAALVAQLQATERFKDRLQVLSAWGTAKAEARWAALEGAPPKSFRKRIANFGNYLLSKIHPAEQFLKSVPPEFTTLHVVHPANVHPTLVRRRIRLLAKRGPHIHRWWTYAAISAIPFTFLLPSPVFFYNLFRIHANWKSWSAGSRLLAHLESSSSAATSASPSLKKFARHGFVPIAQATNVRSDGSSTRFESSKELSNAIGLPFVQSTAIREKLRSVHLTDQQIETICRTHKLDLHGILKWKTLSS